MSNKNMDLKPPKGTRDFLPHDVLIRQNVINKIKKKFILYGCQPIDTPVIECYSTVQKLYGEEFDKSVYTLDSKEGSNAEKLILRYDLTVPFARFVVNNGLEQFKKFQVGKVYRKDQPNISKGRYREFYQCDADFVGSDSGTMIKDIEMLCMMNDILEEILGKGNYKIRVNSRKILYDVLATLGFDEEDFGTICSSLDKLDKVSLNEVCQELTLEKKMPIHKVFMLDQFVRAIQITPTPEVLLQKPYIKLETYDEINTFLTNLKVVDNTDCIVFDPLLSRGLAYYTGIIYEAEYIDKDIMPSSIAAGGRYDTMLDKLGTKGVIPAIGLSIGIERIVTILEATEKKEYTIVPDVFIATVGKNMEIHKLKLACELRDKGVSVDFVYNKNPKMRKQLDYVFNKKIQFMIVIGENEINNDTVNLKFIEEEKQITIPRKDICKYIN